MNPIPDRQAREQALAPEQSFIVQAPAGSGKTELLIQRYLNLLQYVEYPEQILAITFTRKAAGEMKNRIRDALEKAGKGFQPQSDHQKKTLALATKALAQNENKGWRLLDNPDRLKVQTIDSFCASLTRQMPVTSQLGGLLSIQEKPGPLYRQTALRILHKLEDDSPMGDAIRTIMERLDNSKLSFTQRIVQLLEKRDQWMIPFFGRIHITESDRADLENTLAKLVEAVLNESRRMIPEELIAALPPIAAYCGENLAAEDPPGELACLKNLQGFPQAIAENRDLWVALANLLLTKKDEFRKPGGVKVSMGFPSGKEGSVEKLMKTRFIEILESLQGNTALEKELMKIRTLPHTRFSDEEWQVLEASLKLLPEISTTLRRVFAEEGKTDFTEISLSALNALGEETDPTDLLLYLDTKFQHILVDEYQDTSFKQHMLLKLLTAGWERGDGRTLFIVGDPMQSIYRFRDAEVGLFLNTRQAGIGDVHLQSLTLKTNFRSQAKVVDWVNRCFSTVFPAEDDSDLGAISYSASQPFWPDESFAGAVLHPIPRARDKKLSVRKEAEEITALVQSLRKESADASIAVLVRARSHLPGIVQAFNESAIQFKAEEIDPLTTRPAIADLLALMLALMSPLNRVSWLSILRAPWCGLSLPDLHRLCVHDTESGVWQLLHDGERLSRISEDGRTRIDRFKETMTQTFKMMPSADFRDLLEACWMGLGGPACIDASTQMDVDVFFDEISNVLQEGNVTQLESFDRVIENLYASPTAGTETGVHIMTMHKAKGLEFDYVIIPGLGKKGKTEEKRLVFWMPHGEELLMAPIEEKGGKNSEVYDFLSSLNREKDGYETLRLLYVAATRARKQLHLFGTLKADSSSPEKNSLLAKLWPYLQDEWNRELKERTIDFETAGEAEERAIQEHSIRRLPANYKPPEPPAGIDTGEVPELSGDEENEKPEFDWARHEAKSLGNVVHQCLQKIAEDGPESWSKEKIESLRPGLIAALQGEGLSASQAEPLAGDAVKAIKNMLSDPVGLSILSRHEEARSEYPLTGIFKGAYVDKKVDRTFIEDGVRWIIDYKTSKHEGADLQDFFEREKERYKNQLDQYENLFKMKGEKLPIKKALYNPLYKKRIEIP